MMTEPMMAPIHVRHMSLIHAQQYERGHTNQTTMQTGGQKIKFVNPNIDNYPDNLDFYAKRVEEGTPIYKAGMLQPNTTAYVIGSGPSLKEEDSVKEIRKASKAGNKVLFACKQAIKFLHDQGIKMEYGVSMDPGAHIARPEKIYKAPGMTHIIASSSDPLLYKYLKAGMPFADWLGTLTDQEAQRVLEDDYDSWKAGEYEPPDAGEDAAEVMIFHSATGYKNEVEMYNTRFPTHDCMGGGYNVVNRALSAAIFMGAADAVLVGTDCGWREDSSFYVDGVAQRKGVDMTDKGLVEGTDENGNPLENTEGAGVWNTRPDMLASGVALAKLAKRNPGKIHFYGHTLPALLEKKSMEFLDKCAEFG